MPGYIGGIGRAKKKAEAGWSDVVVRMVVVGQESVGGGRKAIYHRITKGLRRCVSLDRPGRKRRSRNSGRMIRRKEEEDAVITGIKTRAKGEEEEERCIIVSGIFLPPSFFFFAPLSS